MSNIYNLADTWNAGGTTFNGIMLDVSNGSGGAPVGAAASRVLNLKKNGISKFSTTIDGEVVWNIDSSLGFFQRPVSISANGVNWRHIVNQNSFPGQGVGGEDYVNEAAAIGWNLSNTVGFPDVVGKAMVWDGWEYKFHFPTGKYQHERHIESVDTSGIRHRPFTLGIPHDGTSGSSHTMTIDRIDWLDFQTEALKAQWVLSDNLANFGSSATGFQLRFNKNNSAPFAQRNAANSAFLSLPYLDGGDYLVASKMKVNASALDASFGAFHLEVSDAPPAGTSIIAFLANTLALGSIYGIRSDVRSNAGVLNLYRNSGTGSNSFYCEIASTTARAEYIAGPESSARWAMGYNGSGHFEIGKDSLGTTPCMTIDKTNLNAVFVSPVKPPIYTVSALPSASTYGSGHRAHVSDATAPVFGATVVGSGAVSTPVYSDGTNWKVG